MIVFQKADLLVKVLTLDDVASREGFHLAEVEDAFVNLVEVAALDVAERHFAGDRQTGASHVDWNGSRLQFWASYSRQVYELVIFQYDHNELAPLVCCASQDFVFGSRSLTAQFAVMRDGRRVDVERLPASDVRAKRRAIVPVRGGSDAPTLHRTMAAVLGIRGRVRDLLRRAAKLASDACRALARWLLAAVAAQRDRFTNSMIMEVLRVVFGRVLAVVGCTAEKCDGSAKNPIRRFGGMIGLDGILARATNLPGWLSTVVFGAAKTTETRNESAAIEQRSDRDDAILCANPVTEDHLATLHGIKPLEPSDRSNGPARAQLAADGASKPGDRI